MSDPNVSVSRPLLYGMVAALAVCLLVVGYLAGRGQPTEPTALAAKQIASAPVAANGEVRAAQQRPRQMPEPRLVAEGAEDALNKFFGQDDDPDAPVDAPTANDDAPLSDDVTTRTPPVDDGAPEPPPPVNDEKKAISLYFETLDGISLANTPTDDPKSVGMGVLQQSLRGDTSELLRMKAQHKDTLAQVERMTVPAACVAHHQAMLDVMREGISLLDAAERATSGKDTGAAMRLATAGQSLMAKTKQVDDLAEQIGAKYGVNTGK